MVMPDRMSRRLPACRYEPLGTQCAARTTAVSRLIASRVISLPGVLSFCTAEPPTAGLTASAICHAWIAVRSSVNYPTGWNEHGLSDHREPAGVPTLASTLLFRASPRATHRPRQHPGHRRRGAAQQRFLPADPRDHYRRSQTRGSVRSRDSAGCRGDHGQREKLLRPADSGRYSLLAFNLGQPAGTRRTSHCLTEGLGLPNEPVRLESDTAGGALSGVKT